MHDDYDNSNYNILNNFLQEKDKGVAVLVTKPMVFRLLPVWSVLKVWVFAESFWWFTMDSVFSTLVWETATVIETRPRNFNKIVNSTVWKFSGYLHSWGV